MNSQVNSVWVINLISHADTNKKENVQEFMDLMSKAKSVVSHSQIKFPHNSQAN